jgi:hypothetical protein
MGIFGGEKKKSGGRYQFRVSDSLAVPLRGYLLRLKLVSGEPALGDIAPGKQITLRSPSGKERAVTVKDYSVTQGVPSQMRLDRTHELDLVIAAADAVVDNETVEIGWTVSGP